MFFIYTKELEIGFSKQEAEFFKQEMEFFCRFHASFKKNPFTKCFSFISRS